MNNFTNTYSETIVDVFFKKIQISLSQHIEKIIFFLSLVAATVATGISYQHGWILSYGDAESHINIAKNVISGLTPGFAQLGGIWLPLTHIIMAPLTLYDPLWRTGLAGSIVSGFFYIVTCIYIFKLAKLITKNVFASFMAFLVFATNFNVLYLQTTPMTEVPLIAFFILSSYYFVKYLYKINSLPSLLLSALFALCASLTRYDGWFLMLIETAIIIIPGIAQKRLFTRKKGDTILFATLAGFGILFWVIWCWTIFGDPLYFDTSVYSAKTQQLAWMQRGELPGYHNILLSLIYYTFTMLSNSGFIIFVIAFIGAITFIENTSSKAKLATLLVLFVPFIFNVLSLFLGQSVIFIPGLTPAYFDYHLFNVRYGVMMIPFMAVFSGYLIAKVPSYFKMFLIGLLLAQSYFFFCGMTPTITWIDGTQGLSTEKVPANVETFINTHYDGGLVLLDSYAKTISIAKSTIPMNDIIYVGNKHYWDTSLTHPEKYTTWVIMQKNDEVWNALYNNQTGRADLYKYFEKVYTSPTILIFRRK